MHKKGISLNSVEKFLSHNADKIRRRTLLCFERILVLKFFKQRRGEASRFCQKIFISQDRKNFAREPFCVLEKFWREKYFMDKRGGGVSRFSVEKFLSDCTEIFHWRTLWCFRKILLSKIFMHRRGESRFCRKFFVSQERNENLCRGTLLFSIKFLVSKKFMDKRGGERRGGGREYHDFLSKIFCLTVPKNFIGEPFCAVFQKISGSQKVYG